ncbi:MAG: PKD domain-containing protein [Bacteroidia bacterium]|nr:PKD domain-containing protein [Bacteroidia bacterium]
MKKLFYLFAFTSLLFLTKNTFASHIVGCDIIYACTSTPNVYKVTMRLYRDCSGIAICPGCSNPLPNGSTSGCTTSSASFLSTSITGAAGACIGTNFGSFTLNAVNAASGYDIVQTCTSVKSICTNCNTRSAGSYSPGIEVFTYEGNVNLSAIPSACCKVALGASSCCRTGALTSMVSGNFYTEAILDRCQTTCNSAPVFTEDAIALICTGVDITYNLGAIDPDGDSLSYSFAPSLQAANTNVSYIAPYRATYPFPYLGAPDSSATFPAGLRIDPITGDLRFRPLGTFVAPFVIGITQWRKAGNIWINVGYTRRDIQLQSIVCASNRAPIIKIYKEGLIQTTKNFTSVSGVPFCLDFVCEDQPDSGILADTSDLRWNNPGLYYSAMSNATFTRNYILSQRRFTGPKADSFKFCWTPPISAIRNNPYTFTVNGKDRFCPVPGNVTNAINIFVNPPTQISIDSVATKRIFCNDRISNTNVKYQANSLTLPNNNIFIVQLSDSLGLFANATTIGTKTSTDTIGLIAVTIPANLPINKNYKIRVNYSSDTSYKGIEMIINFTNGFVKPSIISNKDSICNGLTASLQASPANNNYTYKWLNNNQLIINNSSNLITINEGNYRVIVSNTGCTDTSLVKNLTVLPKPAAGILLSNFCSSPIAVNIGNSSTITSGTMSYNWTFSDNTTSTDLSPSKIFTDSGSITATLIVTSNFNCRDSVTKTIIINKTPKANFTINDTLQCVTGNKFDFTNTSLGTGNTYGWTFGDNSSSGNNNSSKTYTNAGNYLVKLMAIGNGCVDSIIKPITVVAKATNVDFSVNQISQCIRGNNFVFTNNSTPNNTTLSYLWKIDGATVSTLRNPANFSTSKVGVIPVVLVVVANGKCIDTIAKNIIVTANPTIGNILGNVNPNSNVIPFTYSVLNQANTTYNWTTTNATIQSGQGTNQISVLFTNAGNAKIAAQITDNNNCTDSTSLNISVTVGVNELSLENDLKVYPNPTKSILTITNKTNMLGKKYIITNLIGQTVLTGKLNLEETIINTESLNNGIYLLSIDGLNKQSIKVIKE